MKKSVIAISADVIKMNQKELKDFVMVLKIPWRPPTVDENPPMSANVQPMNTSDRVTKVMINAIISVLTGTMPATVSSKVFGSGIVQITISMANIATMFMISSPKIVANVGK
jgi:hypothetical protein